MGTVLLSLRQWGLVTGTVKAPTPTNSDDPMVRGTSTIEAFEVCSISAFMEISIRDEGGRGSERSSGGRFSDSGRRLSSAKGIGTDEEGVNSS